MKIVLTSFLICVFLLSSTAQSFTEILGRPTTTSVTLSLLFDQDAEVYCEYGTASGLYDQTSAMVKVEKDVPIEIKMVGLLPNTKCFYRTRYRLISDDSDFQAGSEHCFHTARPRGSTFTFAIEADPHLDDNSVPEAYARTLQNIEAVNPDFLIDLGDIFMSEKEPIKDQDAITARHLLYRPLYGSVCHSVPLFLVIGNHEGEVGWRLNGTKDALPIMASNTRNKYYPNPLPDSFYSGNTKKEPFVGLRANYYAFEWGDALFVVLDPYWYTVKKTGWGWTLGTEQYKWFEKTITESKAKYKFVFSHQLVGGDGKNGRGGKEFADLYEMGGYNADGTWGWDRYRPDWDKPIHTLMVDNNATIFFHGHDHFYCKQEMDGVVYQEVPQPSNRSLTHITGTEYGYKEGVLLPGRGFLKVTVSPTKVTVDYIRSYLPNEENATRKNGEVAYSYTLKF